MIDDESNGMLDKFNRQVAEIDKVIVWVNRVLNTPSRDTDTDADTAQRGQNLEMIEEKVKAVRKQLKNMADMNAQFAYDNFRPSGTVRYTGCLEDFIAMNEKLESVWDVHRGNLAKEAEITSNQSGSEMVSLVGEDTDTATGTTSGQELDVSLTVQYVNFIFEMAWCIADCLITR